MWLWSCQDGSMTKTWKPEFDPQVPHLEKREQIIAKHTLTFICFVTQMYTHTQINKLINKYNEILLPS